MVKIKIAALFLLCVLFASCSAKTDSKEQAPEVVPQLVIFDTDMGNDIDDAMALDLLYKYMDKGQIQLLGIMINKDYYYSPEYVDIMNTWYGYPDIPIGIHTEGDSLSFSDENYATRVCLMEKNEQYKRSVGNYNLLPKAENLYRKLLSEQPDNSVTVISVGFSTNLAKLLNTTADEYSPLTGIELIAKKVKLLSVMAGSFSKEGYVEYNVEINKDAAREVFAKWPVEIVVSPFELGEAIQFPGTSIEQDLSWTENHPMADGYKAFSQMPYNRPTWDLTSVLYVADSTFFGKSPKGSIHIDEKGVSCFTEDKDGKHSYLITDEEQRSRILDYFIKTIAEKPLRYKSN